MFRRISIPLGLLAIASAPAAFAGTDNPWSATFTLGSELIPSSGRFQARHSATVADLGTIDPKLAGESGTVMIHSRTFKDVYRDGPSATLELGYDLSSQFGTFVRLSYAQLDGRTTDIGDIVVAGQPLPVAVRAEFDDVRSWGFNLGARYFLTDASSWRPYFAGYVGADRGGRAKVHIRVDGTPVDSGTEELLKRQTRFNAGVEFGLAYDFSEQGAVRFSIGGDYRASRHRESAAYEPLGLGPVRVSDQSWTLPIELGLTYKF